MEILRFNPCREAVKYRKQFDTFAEAWDNCPRGDWMLWLAQQLGVEKRLLTLAKGKCAETVKHLMTDERSINAVDTAIAYGKGTIGDDELAVDAATAYAAAAAAAYAADAAAAAAYAADYAADYAAAAAAAAAADYAAAYAADYAAAAAADYAAAADAAAAYAADADAAKKANQKRTADICRELLTDAVMERITNA